LQQQSIPAAASTRRSDYFGWILVALIVVSVPVIRTFVVQPFHIPATSMAPTLLRGDYVLVAKYSYGFSRYSLPFSPPLFSGRIFASEPKRGDVVVFRLPKDNATDYIKRIVGLPGDRVQMINGLLHINGQAVKREQIEDFIQPDGDRPTPVKRWRETLPEGVSHATLDLQANGFYDNTPVHTVPAGHYFMLGDNRDNSTDSRAQPQIGFVPFENLVGRALIVFLAVDHASNNARLERFGVLVR
jgi:signal peptidase I